MGNKEDRKRSRQGNKYEQEGRSIQGHICNHHSLNHPKREEFEKDVVGAKLIFNVKSWVVVSHM